MSLGRCDGCDKPLTSQHIGTVDAHLCAECLAENRTQLSPEVQSWMIENGAIPVEFVPASEFRKAYEKPLVTPRILVRIISRYAGTCSRCHGRLRAGVLIGFEPSTRQTFHALCADDIEAADERQVLPL